MENDLQDKYAQIRRVLLVALCFNLLAWAVKFLLGHWTKSISIHADSVHALLDALSSVLGWACILVSARSLDNQKPYEHPRFESMAVRGISVFMLMGCFEIVMASINRFRGTTNPVITLASFVIISVMIILNGVLSRWEGRIGHLLHSQVLVADALHTRSDVYASISVIIGMIASFVGYPLLDPIAALVIAGVIGYSGVTMLMANANMKQGDK